MMIFVARLLFLSLAIWSLCEVETIPKSIDFFADFLTRIEDFVLGKNTKHWANSSAIISPFTRSFYVCCNSFLLQPDGRQQYTHEHHGGFGTNSFGQKDYVAAGRKVFVTIGLATSPSVSASDICQTTLARKEQYAQELIAIAQHEQLNGYNLDWEYATGNNVSCLNELWGYVSKQFAPLGLEMALCMDNSNHLGPLDLNSTDPWSFEWDYLGAVKWASVLIDMGTYPGPWSKGLSYPASKHLESVRCPIYPKKYCGLKGQVLDMKIHGVSSSSGQLSPGLWVSPCVDKTNATENGWTEEALKEFLSFLDEQGVRKISLWFNNALGQYTDSFTCPWFIPTLVEWAQR